MPNAALEEHGALSACWEGFLTQFVSSRHLATLILATKEWHGWSGRESLLVAETFVPELSLTESVRLLQHLGLKMVPVELLQAVGQTHERQSLAARMDGQTGN